MATTSSPQRSSGRLFLANPDLPRRFEIDAPLATAVSETFYGGGATFVHVDVSDNDSVMGMVSKTVET